jgi:hypothetical protein
MEEIMSITLSEKLASIQSVQTIVELKDLFSQKHKVYISWWGEKMVCFANHNGAVTINTLAKKYLQAAPLQYISLATLEERYDCLSLCGKIGHLYEESDQELEESICQYLIPTLEWKIYLNWIDVEVRIREQIIPEKMNYLLKFSAKTCLKLWPEHDAAQYWKKQVAQYCGLQKTTVTPEMLAQAISREKEKKTQVKLMKHVAGNRMTFPREE